MKTATIVASLLLLASAARAGGAGAKCWVKDSNDRYVAYVRNPAKNFQILYDGKPHSLDQVRRAGVLVVNGTFFSGKNPLADVILRGRRVYAVDRSRRVVRDADDGRRRWVDFGARWGIGVEKGSGRLSVARGDAAAKTMVRYLGGGGLLVLDGRDASWMNRPRKHHWGPSFSVLGILDKPQRRTAVGLINEKKSGRQTLVVVVAEAAESIPRLAYVMAHKLHADQAVFYDGGRAAALAAGGRVLIRPTEDPNPTHIVLRACR